MKRAKKRISTGLALGLALGMSLASPLAVLAEGEGKKEELEAFFKEPEMKYRPYARWWLAEGSHTDETLRESVKELYDAGYGGVEFVTLMSEAEYLDDASYGWGSPEWMHDTKVILSECNKYGMSASMTGGTYWATANLPSTVLTPDDEAASRELGYAALELKGEEGKNTVFEGAVPKCALPGDASEQTLVSVVAAKALAFGESETVTETDPMTGEEVEKEVVLSKTKIDTDSLQVLTDSVKREGEEELLSFDAGDDGDYVLFAFYEYGTSESYTASAAGVNYTINYFDPAGSQALISYWEENVLTEEIQALIDQMEECDLYMDSLELATMGENSTRQLWCGDMLSQFQSRRGYDLEKYLPLLIRETPDGIAGMGKYLTYVFDASDSDAIDIDDLRNDFFQTETELYEENCLAPIRDFLHGHNMSLRAEPSYGKTFELSQTVDSVDYLETESFEFAAEPDLYRNFSGPAHLFGKRLSSETGASIFGNYKWQNGYYRQMAYMQYASGIQKTVVHGYSSPYGPKESTLWPGFEGMTNLISERFNARQPSSGDFSDVNLHMSRLQKALEAGVPQVDIAILRTDYYLNNLLTDVSNAGITTNRIYNRDAYFWKDLGLQDAGYTYDYFAPALLTSEAAAVTDGLLCAGGPAYQAVIVMEDELGTEAAKALLEDAKAGLKVLFVNGVLEDTNNDGIPKENTLAASVTGSNDGKDEELLKIVEQIKALDTSAEVDGCENALEALKELGVSPRVSIPEGGEVLLGTLRKDKSERYLYLYNYALNEGTAFEGSICVEGKVQPWRVDSWSGEVTALFGTPSEDGNTLVPLTLEAGDTALLVFTEEEAAKMEALEGKEEEIPLEPWSLSIDSYTPGGMLTREEDNEETGVHTEEVTFASAHETIDAGTLTELLPWKDIPALGEFVSGSGSYTTRFTLPEDFDPEKDTVSLRAGDLNQGTASLTVNGEKLPINMDTGFADLTGACKGGENEIVLTVSGSLRNVGRTTGYLFWLCGDFDPGADDYGLTGQSVLTLSRG